MSSAREALAHEEREVAAVVLHPGFDNRSLAHDVALLRLRRPAIKRAHVDVVCLPRRDQDNAASFRSCVITGWGRRSEGNSNKIFFSYYMLYYILMMEG